jgi:hypothetical protein
MQSAREGKVLLFRETAHPMFFFFSRPSLQSCRVSHVYSISEFLPHCKQKPTNPKKKFELQNENFKLGQELEESDTQLYECGTTVGG